MAVKTLVHTVLITVVLLLVVMEASSGHQSGKKHFFALFPEAASPIQSREVLGVIKSGLHERSISTKNRQKKVVYTELRNAPSGPDPLHHNGGGPKKPKTP